MAAKAHDVDLSHSGRKIAGKPGESKGGLGFHARPLLSWRYKLPRLFEFPILPKQAFKFIFHSRVVCLVEFASQSIHSHF
jgi:hypothetical protein